MSRVKTTWHLWRSHSICKMRRHQDFWIVHDSCHTFEWVTKHEQMSHVSHMQWWAWNEYRLNGSCHTRPNESCHTCKGRLSESCHTCTGNQQEMCLWPAPRSTRRNSGMSHIMYYNALHHTAPHYTTLQHTAYDQRPEATLKIPVCLKLCTTTHCTTLRHTATLPTTSARKHLWNFWCVLNFGL